MLELHNYTGVMEVLSTLHMAAISRLKQCWELVSAQSMAYFDRLNALMSPLGNWRHYRSSIVALTPPFVPFIGMYRLLSLPRLIDVPLTFLSVREPAGVYLSDCTMIDEGNPSLVNGDINLEKMQMTAIALWQFERCKWTLPAGSPEPPKPAFTFPTKTPDFDDRSTVEEDLCIVFALAQRIRAKYAIEPDAALRKLFRFSGALSLEYACDPSPLSASLFLPLSHTHSSSSSSSWRWWW